MGERLEGFIIYSPDGYMSVQLMRPDRSKFSSGDWSDGSESEIREAAAGRMGVATSVPETPA